MTLFRGVMANLLVIVFGTTLLDILLPDGSLRRYVKMTMGFFVVLTLLQPLAQLLGRESVLAAWDVSLPAAAGEGVRVESAGYEAQARALDRLYGEKIAAQAAALLELSGVRPAAVRCEVESQCLRRVTVWLDDEADAERIARALCGYYGLDASQVAVRDARDAPADG